MGDNNTAQALTISQQVEAIGEAQRAADKLGKRHAQCPTRRQIRHQEHRQARLQGEQGVLQGKEAQHMASIQSMQARVERAEWRVVLCEGERARMQLQQEHGAAVVAGYEATSRRRQAQCKLAQERLTAMTPTLGCELTEKRGVVSVRKVHEGGAGQQGGLKVQDVIEAAGGTAVRDSQGLTVLATTSGPGGVLPLRVLRTVKGKRTIMVCMLTVGGDGVSREEVAAMRRLAEEREGDLQMDLGAGPWASPLPVPPPDLPPLPLAPADPAETRKREQEQQAAIAQAREWEWEGGESDEGDGGDPYSDEEMYRREQFLLDAVPPQHTSTVSPLASGQEGPPPHKRSISAPGPFLRSRQTAENVERKTEGSVWGVLS
jgi:hypothetical protein